MTLGVGGDGPRVPLLLQRPQQSCANCLRGRLNNNPEVGAGEKLWHCAHSGCHHGRAASQRLEDYVGPSLLATCKATHIGSAEITPKLLVGYCADEVADVGAIQVLCQLLKRGEFRSSSDE